MHRGAVYLEALILAHIGRVERNSQVSTSHKDARQVHAMASMLLWWSRCDGSQAPK